MGTLYLVSTPIGNLEDISFRAVKILFSVDYIASEDTRKAGLLLKNLQEKGLVKSPCGRISIKLNPPQLISYYEENEEKRIPEIIKLLKNGYKVALTSGAGTPLVSDPGFKLVRESARQGIKIEAVPGASACLAALTCSGLPTDKFLFLGYLPKKSTKRLKILRNLVNIYQYILMTVIIYESPYRLLKTLKDIQEVFGDQEIVICRELTKLHEEIRRGKVNQIITYFEKTKPRGEFVLLFHPGQKEFLV
jgi:16S rRNA (cytidine1402-2'-O)-methyltransferase